MKRFIVLLLHCALILPMSAQENCNDAIDNDGDGLTDLLDDECQCEPVVNVVSLIPNPSFEDTVCCPNGTQQISCARDWIQASNATSDFIHTCDDWWRDDRDHISQPFPDGNGVVFLRMLNTMKEYVGACLIEDMQAGTRYQITFDIQITYSDLSAAPCDDQEIELGIFGTPDCANELPFGYDNNDCPLDDSLKNWQQLGTVTINSGDFRDWGVVEITFVPTFNVNGIALGTSCMQPECTNDVMILDNLLLNASDLFGVAHITIDGTLCENDAVLSVEDVPGRQYQWYLDSVAIIGEVNNTLNLSAGGYGPGNYQVRVSSPDGCAIDGVFVTDACPVVCVDPDLGPDTTVCNGGSLILDAGDQFDEYLWSDGSTGQTLHVTEPGVYSVQTIYREENVIFNGDFEAGSVGFTSDYIVGLGGNLGPLSTEGTYFVTTSPNIAHNNFATCDDHTDPGTQMMVVNGADVSNRDVWCQSVQVQPFTEYEFSTWVWNSDRNAPARLSFFVDGVQLGSDFSPVAGACDWSNFFETWTSGNVASVDICIVNQSTVVAGNDFALDDISFAPVCRGTDEIEVRFGLELDLAAQPVSCFGAGDGAITTVIRNATGNLTYNWSPTGSGSSLSDLDPGTYTLTVIDDGSTCEITGEIEVVGPDPFVVAITDRPVDCNGTLNGTAYIDDCGTCVAGTTGKLACQRDCNRDWGGTAFLDDCGNCVGGNTGDTACIYLIAQFDANTWFVDEGGNIVFVDASLGNNISSWVWNFGNGANPPNAIGEGPHSVNYIESGIQTVTLTINDGQGNESIFTRNVNIVSTSNGSCEAIYSEEFNTLPAINHYEEFVRDVQTNRVVNSDALTSSIVDGALHVESDGSEHTTASLPLTGAPINFANGRFITIRIRASEAMAMRVTLRDGNLTQAQMDQLQPQTDLNITTDWQEFVIDLSVVAQLQDGWIFQGNNFNEQVLHHLVLIPNPNEHDIAPYIDQPFNGWFEVDYFLIGTNSSDGCVTLDGDCFGIVGGSALIDSCGDCTGGLTGIEANDQCEFDCNGDANGTAFIDSCGVCAGGNTNMDPNSSCTIDCHGDIDGTAFVDNCGQCVSGLTDREACEQDCEGIWGGSAYEDNCGDCVAGNTGLEPCSDNCISSPLDLSVMVVSGGTPLFTYVWDNGLGTSPTLDSVLAGTYSVTVTDSAGCVADDDTTIVIGILNVDAGEDQSFCAGDTGVQLNGTGGATFEWSPGTGLSDSTIANPIARPDSTTIYVLTSSDGSCEGTDTVVVFVHNLPDIGAGIDSSICLGDSLDIAATGGVRYFWDNGLDSGVTHTVRPTTTTTYRVTGLDTNGCADTAAVEVSVDPSPNIIANDTRVCQKDTISLVATGGLNYSWVSLDIGVITTGPDDVQITVQSGDPDLTEDTLACFEVTGSDANSCVNKDTACVNFEVNCGPIVEATGDTICEGELGNLNAMARAGDGDYTFTWIGGNLVNETGADQTDSPTTTTTYQVIVQDGNGERDTTEVYIVVHALPAVTAEPDTAICLGDTATIRAAGANTYTWDNDLSDDSIHQVTPTGTTTYNVTGIDINGCENTATLTVTVNTLPVVSAEDTQICKEDSVQLQATGATNYFWTSLNDGQILSDTNIADPWVFTGQPAATTDVQACFGVLGIDNNGCMDTAVACVSFEVNCGPLITALGDTICIGETGNLSAAATMGDGDYTFTWNGGNLVNATGATQTDNPTATTDYTVIVTDGNNDRDTAIVQLVVYPLPTITALADDTICRGSSDTIYATGAATYQWDNGSTDSSQLITPTVTTTYTVTGTDTNDCVNTDSVTITVDYVEAEAGNDINICVGGQAQLTASGGDTYRWTPNDGTLSSTTIVNPIATPTDTTTYYVEVRSAIGHCVAYDSVTINTGGLVVDLGPDDTLCLGESYQFNVGVIGDYSWQSDNDTLSSTTVYNPLATPTVTSIYTVHVSDPDIAGCEDRDSITIYVEDVTAGIITAPQIICRGDELLLTATGGGTYQWTGTPSGTNITNPTSATPTVAPLIQTTYTVTVSNSSGKCSDTAELTIDVDSIVASASADFFMCLGSSSSLLNVTAPGATSYSWNPTTYLDNATIANPQIVNPTVAGTISYEVSVSNANNCVDKDTVEVTIGDVIVNAEALSPRFCVDDTGQVRATTTTTGALFSWQSDGGILIGTSSQTPGFTAADTGTYILTVTATDGNGQCPDVDSTTIAVANVYADAGVDTTVCKDDELTLNGAYGPSYSWSPTEQLLANADAFNPTVNTSGSGIRLFVLTVTDNSLANCEATDTVEVTVEEVTVTAQVGPDNIMEGETAVLNATTNGTIVSWWELETGEDVAGGTGPYPATNNIIVSPIENRVYIVESYNDNDCSDMDSVYLEVISAIKIPNVFTPNDDGVNDSWTIANIEDYPDAEIRVTNRWGNTVWKQKNGYDNQWDGRSDRGASLPIGTYYFDIQLNFRGLRYSGDVTILR